MRQEYKDEAAVLIRRLAEAQQKDPIAFIKAMRGKGPFYVQLGDLVREVARTLPTPAAP